MKQYIVDVFTDKVFSGNPAAVCIMKQWINDTDMQNIAMENNLSETAFAVKEQGKYHLRWFTPVKEINLCGHATMACAYVVLNFYERESNSVIFDTVSGDLTVEKRGDLYEMDFPAFHLQPVPITKKMEAAIGVLPKEAYLGRDLLCVLDDESVLQKLHPDMEIVKELDGELLHVTACGKYVDCVSRSFAPKYHIPEDPVCGSGHCHIIPYWSKKLQKENIIAHQASKRGGMLYCTMQGDRVILGGKAVLYASSDILMDCDI